MGSEGLMTTAHSQAAGGTGGGAEELGAEGQSRWVVQGPEEAGGLRARDAGDPAPPLGCRHAFAAGAHLPPSPPSPVGICWGDACHLVGGPRCIFWSPEAHHQCLLPTFCAQRIASYT